MEGNTSPEGAHEPNINEASPAIVEIKIKTLDSQVYTCQVARNVSVPNLKEQIASLTGVPVGNQRLICRGKVLKDEHVLSAYDVEDGHTLHLVTRPAPQPNSPATSTGARSEDQDSHRFTSRNRPGQVSHSVVLGTFNIPDHGDGALPEINRILSSVLSSLRIGNLFPTATGASNGSTGMATAPSLGQQSSIIDAQGREEGAGGRSQAETDIQSPTTEQGGSGDMGLSSDAVPGLRSGVSFVGSLPAPLPQIRLVQQAMVVPDALTTLSQYLNRVEQIFATYGQVTNQGSSPQTQSSNFSEQTEQQQTPVQGDGPPAAWSAIIHRTQELLSNQAGSELARLADRLANEPNLQTGTARQEILSAGILMQHLGDLLLELGRTMLTLRMGSSPADSAVTAGPAVFITGPNAMMVQQGGGPGTLNGMAPQSVVGPDVAVSSSDAPQNSNIQVHAGDVGLSPAFSLGNRESPSSSQPITNGFSSSLALSVNDAPALPAFQNQTVEIANHAVNGNTIAAMQPVLGSMQGPLGFGEHGTLRVLPMRTLVAVPASLQPRPTLEAAGAGMGVFYPLLARFQQLNPAQFSQQLSSSHAASGNELHPLPPLPPRGILSGQQQSMFPLAHPTVRAQVQVQAWLPSGGQVNNGNAGPDTAGIDGTPSSNEAPIQQQELVETESGSDVENASNRVRSLATGISENNGNVDESFQKPVMEGPVLPLSHAAEGVQASVDRKDQIESEQIQASNKLSGQGNSEPRLQLNCGRQTEVENEQSNCTVINSKLIQDGDVLSVISKPNEFDSGASRNLHVEEAPSAEGLALDGFQPLPSRKRAYFQREEQVSTFEESLCDLSNRLNEPAAMSGGETVLQDFLSSLASRAEERAEIVLGAEHLSHAANDGLFLSSRNTNTEDVMPHLVSGWPTEHSLQGNGGVGLGTLLASADMGGTMGQQRQIPVLGAAVQQIRDNAQGIENVLSQNPSDQGVANFGGVLQQMIPMVSQGAVQAPLCGSENSWSPMHELHLGHGENGRVMETGFQSSSQDCKKVSQIQESSVSAEDVALHQSLSGRPASDSSHGRLPVSKRQKMQ